MDTFFNKVYNLLRADCRMSVKRISETLGCDEKKVTDAIEKMESDGTILRYTVLGDEDKLGREVVRALIEVRVSPAKTVGFDAIADEIRQYSEVKDLYLMSGGYDLAVFIEGKSLKEVAMFVSEKLSVLDNVLSTATHFILKKYKTDGEFTNSVTSKRLAVAP